VVLVVNSHFSRKEYDAPFGKDSPETEECRSVAYLAGAGAYPAAGCPQVLVKFQENCCTDEKPKFPACELCDPDEVLINP
jgi:hypothetical protein